MADHFVIDGSNLATEGRTEPSLAQLHEAVAAFLGEHPGVDLTVVVDASFEHRIDPAERAAFSKTEAAGEVVSPPAGAVGRGDGFLLQIADRTGGTVISNDSFQEFHAEYEWLFEPGRLIGGKPVPGVGWIFSLRRPVRGIVSRKTVQKAKQSGQTEKAGKKVQKAIAEATASALQPDAPKRRRRRGGRGRSSSNKVDDNKAEPEAVNEPASFLQFVIDHRLGTEVSGTVDAFASHGAFVNVDGVRCYVPLSAMGNPQPSRARDVLTKDETRTFVVQAVDAPRRGIELGLPGFATVAGAPSEETVAAEVGRRRPKKAPGPEKADGAGKAVAKKVTRKTAAAKPKPEPRLEVPAHDASAEPVPVAAVAASSDAPVEPVAKQTRSQKKVAAKERRVAEVMETIAAEKAAAEQLAVESPAKRSRRRGRGGGQAPEAQPVVAVPVVEPAAKVPATRKAVTKKTTAKKAKPVAKTTGKKTAATAPVVKKVAAAKTPTKKASSAKKAPATKKAQPVKDAPVVKKVAAKKSAPKKAAAKAEAQPAKAAAKAKRARKRS